MGGAFKFKEFPVLPIVSAHLIINCIITFLAVTAVGLRVLTRYQSGAKLWWDDYLILLAVPQGIGMLVIQGMYTNMGVGFPLEETMENLVPILKMLVAYELIFCTAISTIKLSVMLFYLRVFVNQGLRLATKLAMGFVVLWSTGNFLQVFLLCRPFAASYNPAIKGKCGNQVASFIAIGAFNIVTDILILALPIPTVWALKMATAAKIGLTAVFALGLIVCVISVVRIVTLTNLDMTHLTETMIWPDFWSAMEINLAILCVSMPMLGTLFARCTPSSRRGASKLEGPSGSGTSGSGFNRLKNRSGRRDDEEFGLESIYHAGLEEQLNSHSLGAGAPPSSKTSRNAPTCTGGAMDDAGSEIVLNGASAETLIDEKEDSRAIKVQTKWTISTEHR
ncbi:hypothetical protein B0H63DRAFT_418684 [Podospora didyma]|uniref:Rhodopsin domain-containing protein n=1 Tax=Podospora didyma TaxID=330526 RepID=A0AAE0N8D2_9PEZI|nr:hypothetical protein B0H63DRAFT_418684 [Podospora didyma]